MKKLAFGFVLSAAVALCAARGWAAGTLPAGYTEVEYIQGNGSDTRIVTDYTPQPNTDKIEAVVSFPTLDKTMTIWCARGSSTTTASWTMFMINDSGYKLRLDYGSVNNKYFAPTLSANTKYMVTAEGNVGTWTNGTGVTHTKVADFTAGGPVTLFASYVNGTGNSVDNWGKHRLYSFKVWRSDALIHYFVPCKDANNAATLVDICDNPATLTKSGTFTAGQAGHYYDDTAFGSLTILPIPNQLCLAATLPEPGFTVTNTETGASWDYGEGGVASGQTPFDVAYSFTNGYGTVTVTGKAGSEYEGKTIKRNYKLTHDLIVNGDFESGAWAPGWTASGNYAKIDTSGSAYQPNASTTFISGVYCAILQKQNVASQVFTNDRPWCAELTWKCKQRGGYSDIPYAVILDGERIFYEDFPVGTSEVHYRTVKGIVLHPGEHTLTFQTLTSNDRTLFLDDVSLKVVSKTYLEILPIPNLSCVAGACRPECIVSNFVEGQSWLVGGDIVSPDFDVEYTNNAVLGVATVTATGKGDWAGHVVSRTFSIVEDENISTTDTAARYLQVGDNVVYVFTNAAAAQTVTVRKELVLDKVLLVGGGGAGGTAMGGGAGGGGVLEIDDYRTVLSPGETINFTVGVGGAPSTGSGQRRGGNGGNTVLVAGSLAARTAKGGGGGAGYDNGYRTGGNGGSGGGGTYGNAGGSGVEGQGYAGGNAGSEGRSGGGGGAGEPGHTYTTDPSVRSGDGGAGRVSIITGEEVYYGGGGGGGGSPMNYGAAIPGDGGLGGGGNGARSGAGYNGTDGLGGGGGGGGWTGGSNRGGAGGCGTVILSFKVSEFGIDPVDTQFLTPGGCFPEPVVRDGGTLLVKDSDYTVAYTNNTATGVATITVTGIGTYAGMVGYATFNIFNRYFAKPEVAEEGDGLSWATAMSVTNLFATLGTTSVPYEAWIAAGTVSARSFIITNNANLVIRGGFAGTETTLAERPEGTFTVFDGENTVKCPLTALTGENAELTLDRIKFYRAKENGFIKTGVGSLRVINSVIEGNGKDVDKIFGRGMNVNGGGAGGLVVSNCVFKGNVRRSGVYTYGGFGIYVSSFSTALVEDSLFVTNGYAIAAPGANGNCGADGGYGSAMRVIDTPVTVRRCRFSGNVSPLWKSSDSGGVLALTGACGGSVIENCAFVGNTDRAAQQASADINTGGALAVRLSSAAGKVKVRNCTFAYNIAHGHYSAGGISVAIGDVDIENSIFWKNTRARVTTYGYGSDVQVSSGSTASIRNSLVTTLDGTALAGAGLTIDETSVFVADPRLVTTNEEFTNLLTVTSSSIYYNPSKSGIYESLAAMDVHLKSPAGYVVNGGAAGPATTDYSPAIDLGDPEADYSKEPTPNGGRLNIGAYGNTAEASCTATGQPEADVAMAFLDGTPRPFVRIAMGLVSGTGNGYSSTVRLFCSTNGVLLAGIEYRLVVNGDVIEWKWPDYLEPGTTLDAVVTIFDSGAETVVYNMSEPVTGTYPPYYGKGGDPDKVIHVRTGADCKMDGTSWTDAYPDLATALKFAPDASKTEVWLAVTNDHLNIAATISYPIVIRGGFTGVENSPEERPDGYRSTIDGCDSWDGFAVNNAAAVDIERIKFIRGLNCGLIKSGAGDLLVSDCIFLTNGTERAGNTSGKGARVSGTKATTVVTFTNCVFRGNRVKATYSSACAALGSGINGSSLKCLRLENCYFVHNGNFLRSPGGANSGDSSTGNFSGSAVYSSAPVSAVGCRFIANFGTVINSNTTSGGNGGAVRLVSGAEGSAFTNCAWVANGEEVNWTWNNKGPNDSGALVVHFGSASGTVDVERCTFAYNLNDGYETTAGLNLSLGTANIHNSIFFGNILGGASTTRGRNISLRGDSVCNVSYTLFDELGSDSVTCASTATTNFLDGIVVADPLFVTEYETMTNLVKTSSITLQGSKLIFWDWTAATAEATYAALENVNCHLRGGLGYHDEATGSLVTTYARGAKSPCIDKGDPKSEYHREPAGYNGRRVNMGYYGNSPWASMSQPAGSVYYLR